MFLKTKISKTKLNYFIVYNSFFEFIFQPFFTFLYNVYKETIIPQKLKTILNSLVCSFSSILNPIKKSTDTVIIISKPTPMNLKTFLFIVLY